MLFEWDATQPDHVLIDGSPVPIHQVDRYVRGQYENWENDWASVPGLRAVK